MEAIFSAIDDIMYYPILIIVLAAAGLYFTIRTHVSFRFVFWVQPANSLWKNQKENRMYPHFRH